MRMGTIFQFNAPREPSRRRQLAGTRPVTTSYYRGASRCRSDVAAAVAQLAQRIFIILTLAHLSFQDIDGEGARIMSLHRVI
jgi:hypothetical protein